jgi:hypothetical protein
VHHDAAVTDDRADRRVRLVVERHVPLMLGQVGAERAADLRGARGRPLAVPPP